MSYTLEDAMRDEAYEAMSRELYPEHRDQAIEEFTFERLQSYYLKNPDVAVNALGSYKEAQSLLEHGHPSACIVFAVTSIEQFLKAALLRPVVFGLIHMESLAALIVDVAMDQNGGLDRYRRLLAGLFKDLAGIDLGAVCREGSPKSLLEEVKALQERRNSVVHRGAKATDEEAKHALHVANAVFSQVFIHLLAALRLQIVKGGHIVAG
jgi:hypothetical protein